MKSTSIFVSRELDEDSPIRKLHDKYNVEITARSLINFTSVSFEWPQTNWIYFYSRKGVAFFFNQKPPKKYQIGCFGPATAVHCNKFAPVQFESNADPHRAVEQIESSAAPGDITFICGRKSLRTVQHLMSDLEYIEIVVYDQHPLEDVSLEHYDIAVLTSPLNVETFMKNEGTAGQYVAIGNTTAKAIRNHAHSARVAPMPSEEGISRSVAGLLRE